MHLPLNPNVAQLKPSATLAMNEKSAWLEEQGKKVYRLGFGQSPFPVPHIVVKALQENAHQKAYLPVKGLYPLRQAAAQYLNYHLRLNRQAENIFIGPGSKELLYLLQVTYQADLLLPRPSWVTYQPQAQINKNEVIWIPTTEKNAWCITSSKLEDACKKNPDSPKLLLLNYPNNPTGVTYSPEHLQELAKVAKKYKLLILADEIYGELHHEGQHKSIAKYYPEGTIVSTGLSKWCGAGGWRLGLFYFPPEYRWLLDSMSVVASETFSAVSAPIQYAAIVAYSESEELANYLHHTRRILNAVGQYVSTQLHKAHLSHPISQGGFYIYPNFTYYQKKLHAHYMNDSITLCNTLLEDTGVALLAGSHFGSPDEQLVARLSYVNFDGEQALDLAQNDFKAMMLSDSFVKIACPDLVAAIARIVDWVKQL